jgi:hypothetical protein
MNIMIMNMKNFELSRINQKTRMVCIVTSYEHHDYEHENLKFRAVTY